MANGERTIFFFSIPLLGLWEKLSGGSEPEPERGEIKSLCALHVWNRELYVLTWQTQVENEHYSTVSGLIRLVISLECFIEIIPDFLCPFMND